MQDNDISTGSGEAGPPSPDAGPGSSEMVTNSSNHPVGSPVAALGHLPEPLGDDQRELMSVIGATFDHVAVAAPRIRDLLALWRDTMGGVFAIGADNPDRIGWRTVRLRFGGNMVIELIEPLAGATFFDRFFAKNPSGGVHHVTFVVDDVEHARDCLAEHGFAPFGHTPGYQVFVHPRSANGVLLQLMKRYPLDRYDVQPYTLDDVLDGHGIAGVGVPSP